MEAVSYHGATVPSRPRSHHFRGFTITIRHTALVGTPLDERSARRRGLYLTTHNTQKKKISMPSVGFELVIPAGQRPQTRALGCAANGSAIYRSILSLIHFDDEIPSRIY